MSGRIRFMTLPLFLNGWIILQYARRRFGFFGKQVVRAVVAWNARLLSLEMGAVIGRARPHLVDRTIRSQSDPGARIEVLKAIMREALENRLAKGSVAEFADFEEQRDPLEGSEIWVDADEALGDLTICTMTGLVFGSEHPDLTKQLVERRLAERADDVITTLEEAGLKLPPGRTFRTYDDWEEYLLHLVDTWAAKWGGQS
jgi:hypothetical protein